MPCEQKTSCVSLRRSEMVPALPASLEQEMHDYLRLYREALEHGAFGERTEAYGKAYDERGAHLVDAAHVFDERSKDGIGGPQVILGDEMRPVLDRINFGTKISSRGPNFSEAITNYYDLLDWSVDRVVSRTQMRGINYLMDGVKGHNEDGVTDLESFLLQFKSAKSRVNDETLRPLSPQYKLIDDERVGNEEKGLADRLEKVEVYRSRIICGLEEVVRRMQEPDGQDEETAGRLLEVTSDLMHHLSQNLGETGLAVVGEKGKRPLATLPDGPLHQLEAMLAIQNLVVRDYQELVTYHRDLFRGTPRRVSLRNVS
jgi:hypothetical protein